jgi:hypothetical protein
MTTLKAPLFVQVSEREKRLYRSLDTKAAVSQDDLPYRRGDERPNTGMREGLITHEEVNEALRHADMTVIFGQQTRIRDGVMLPDRRLQRFHAGHDMVNFFYGAVRQLPEYFITALLESNVSVTLVKGPELLVFHGPREHQAFHVGRTRRTIYVPNQVLRAAFEKGYDYWSLTEVIITESWPLLDYLLLLELIRVCQYHLRSHYTLGYSFVRDNLLRFNHHRRLEEDNPECEFETLFRHYSDALFALDRKIVDVDPFDIVDEIFDESRERFWANLKLYEISTAYRYPTYFQIDRDIVHAAAYRTAKELSIPLEPQSPADVIHDLWDESRFTRSRSVKTEELLERLIEFGADGIRTFYETVAEEVTYGLSYVTASRHDDFNIHTGFDELLGSYTGAEHARAPGSTIADSGILYRHFLKLKRRKLLEEFKELSPRSQAENAYLMKEMLCRVIEVKLSRNDAPSFQRRVEFSDSARMLIETGDDLLRDRDDEEDRDVVGECLAAILSKLQRHPLFHSEFMAQYRSLTGDPTAVVVEDIRPLVNRLAARLPDAPLPFTSDPHGFRNRLLSFVELKKSSPSSKRQLTLLAGLLLRLDKSDEYQGLLDLVRAVGEYAIPELEEVTTNHLVYGDKQRAQIREAAKDLLEEMNEEEVATAKETAEDEC